MNQRIILATILSLCISGLLLLNGCFLSPSQPSYSPPATTRVPESTPEPTPTYRHWEWQPSPGHILEGGSWAYFPAGGAYVEAGHTLTLHWSSDSPLDGFILTANQFDNMDKHLGVVSAYLAKGSGTNKTIVAHVQNSDKYYAVVRNLSVLAPSVKLYEATLTEE